MNKSNNLKDEGKAGLFYAKNSAGTLVAAKDAVREEDYRCPICGCNMCPKTLPSGTRIFARKPRQVHTNSICFTAEQKRTEKSFDGLKPEEFINDLCHAVPRKKTSGPDTHPDEGRKESKPNFDADDEAKLSSFTSLKQISESGIAFLNAYDKQGDYYVSDFIMTYKFGDQFFSNPTFNLGARIVYARFDWVDFNNTALNFSLFGKNYSVKFRILFAQTNKKAFKTIWEKLGNFQANEKGKTVFKKFDGKHEFLIASDTWNYIPQNQCIGICAYKDERCANCKGMYQATFASTKQIYRLPE